MSYPFFELLPDEMVRHVMLQCDDVRQFERLASTCHHLRTMAAEIREKKLESMAKREVVTTDTHTVVRTVLPGGLLHGFQASYCHCEQWDTDGHGACKYRFGMQRSDREAISQQLNDPHIQRIFIVACSWEGWAKRGEWHGDFTFWEHSGQMHAKMQYQEGKFHGLGRAWWSDEFVHHAPTTVNADGSVDTSKLQKEPAYHLLWQGSFQQGKLHGKLSYWFHPTSRLKYCEPPSPPGFVATYKEGIRHGLTVRASGYSKPEMHEIFEDGEVVRRMFFWSPNTDKDDIQRIDIRYNPSNAGCLPCPWKPAGKGNEWHIRSYRPDGSLISFVARSYKWYTFGQEVFMSVRYRRDGTVQSSVRHLWTKPPRHDKGVWLRLFIREYAPNGLDTCWSSSGQPMAQRDLVETWADGDVDALK